MIAYAFPPLNFSGTARPFGFACHLPSLGYRPTIITRCGTADRPADPEMLARIPDLCEIRRAKPWDSDDWPNWLRGRLRLLDCPLDWLGFGKNRLADALGWRADRFWPGFRENLHWAWPAFIEGVKILLRGKIDLIWATGDPWSSLRAAYNLAGCFRLPLVADFRDPWTYGILWNPETPTLAEWNRRWQRKILARAAKTVFASPLTCDIMARQVAPDLADRFTTITNGFDPAPCDAWRDVPSDKCLFAFVGNLSPAYRDPRIIIDALRLLPHLSDEICFQFVGNMNGFESIVDQNLVRHLSPVSHIQSRRCMRGADVLVLLQTFAGLGSDVVSGKAYEYLAARKPILAVVPEQGGDAWLVRSADAGMITGISDPKSIARAIEHYHSLWKSCQLTQQGDHIDITPFSHLSLTRQLAALFDRVLADSRRNQPCRAASV